MGIKTLYCGLWREWINSEKPPHHMGIKTFTLIPYTNGIKALKNLPTTWGLRRIGHHDLSVESSSEKPPHHMGIKTFADFGDGLDL